MPKLTKKRKEELLKLYPNAEAVGRAYIMDFVGKFREKQGCEYTRNFKSKEEHTFLFNYLQEHLPSDEEVEKYNNLMDLQTGLTEAIRGIRLAQQIYLHGYYKAAYTMQGLNNEIKLNQKFLKGVLSISPSVFFGEDLVQKCKELGRSWDYVRLSQITIPLEDFLLEIWEKQFNFDFSALRPNLNEFITGFKTLQEIAHDTAKTLRKNKKAFEGEFATELLKTLKKIQDDEPTTEIPVKEIEILTDMTKTQPINEIINYVQRRL